MSLKTRELEANIAKHGVEGGIKYTMLQLIEEQHAVREAVANLAEMMNQMADTLLQITQVATIQKDNVDMVKKTLGIDDGGDDGAQSRDG